MGSLLLALIYICFVSLGLPDSLLPICLLILLFFVFILHECVLRKSKM